MPGEVHGRSPLAGQWERFDANGNGLIEPQEFDQFQAYAGPTPEVDPAGSSRGRVGAPAPRLGPEYAAPGFRQLDISGDGVLSKGEAAGRKGLLDEWWQVDQNKDNVIDRAEFSAFEVYGPTMPPQSFPAPPTMPAATLPSQSQGGSTR